MRVLMQESATLAFYKAQGGLIRRKRSALRQTQEGLAALIGLSRATVANIETGRQQLLVHQLHQIARALDLPVEELLLHDGGGQPEAGRDLPLPSDLTPRQKSQIAGLLSGAGKGAMRGDHEEKK